MKITKLFLLLAVFCTALSMQSCQDESEDMMPDCPIGFTGVDCDIADLAEIQNLLDEGRTPLELINDNNISLSSLYGRMYEGGLIFHIDMTNGSGMVAAVSDQSTGARWGCNGDEITGAEGKDLGTGAQNTIDILTGCDADGIGARICDELELNGYTDWFLPSQDELNLMWLNLADSDGDGYNSGADHEGNLGGFAAAFYLSSTEYSDQRLWVQFFSSGLKIEDYKGNFNNVRAARAF